ncbi:MAG: transporter substrate-binding domain-containing protein [Rhodospirillales bacterium]|nr:transporter substrate-binding domain-containing protein [Rhodospirillales bacterium]
MIDYLRTFFKGLQRRPVLSLRLVLLLSLSILFVGADALAESSSSSVRLTPAEKSWLAEHSEVRLAVDINWAPFEFIDENNNYQGMAAEYIELVEKRLGITFKVDKERPWAEMVEAVKNRDLDAFSLVVRTPQRDEFVNFTQPYISFPMVIVTRENEPYIDGISALRKQTVSVVKSYASHDLLARNHTELTLHLAENVKKGLEAVSNGQTYAFVGNLAVASQVIRESGITNLKISGQTPYRFELSMAVRKDWPQLIPILQKALDSISPEERDTIYNHWIRVKFQEEVDYRIVFVVLGVGLLVALVFLIWNWKLQKEINHRQRVEADLKNKSQRLDEIIWGTDIGTWEWNIQTGETVINERWAEIAGYTLKELAPISIETWKKLAHPEDLELSNEIVKKNFSRELDHYKAELRVRHKNGHWIWALVRGKVVEWTTGGQPLRMSGTHQDITERKKLDRMKSEFVSTVSHELRTPLTSIKGSLGLVAGGALGEVPDKSKEMIDVAYKNTDRLIGLVNDILDIEKLESGSMEFDFVPLNITDLVIETVEANRGFAQECDVDFVLTDLPDEVKVQGDENRLTQVLANLLSNAAKFSPSGEKVEISVERMGDKVKVLVTDNGPGIPEEFYEHIFGRFAQADGSDSKAKGGTGLGLSISKSIVERHRGTIDFVSDGSSGSVFFFSLPTIQN